MSLLQQLTGILLPVFGLACVGFLWSRTRVPFEREFVTRVVMNLAAPCLILDTLSHLSLPAERFFAMLGVAIAVLLMVAGMATGLLLALRLPIRSFLPPLVFGNAGNTGLPLCFFAFGPEGLGLGIAFFIVGSTAQFVLAPMLQSAAPAWRSLLGTPVIYATVFGLALLVGELSLPAPLETTIGLMGQVAIPLMLVAMGHALGGFRVAAAGRAAGLGVARLVLGFAVGLLATWLFQLDGVFRGVTILQSAMPAAVFNYLLAARYRRHATDVAGIVLVSSLLSAATLPLLLAWLLAGA